jgi:glucokinase
VLSSVFLRIACYNQVMDHVIGVDLGGTQLRAALINSAGSLLAHTRAASLVGEGPLPTADRIAALAAQVAGALPAGSVISGLGLGAPGPLDPVSGVVMAPPNLPGWYDVPLRDLVQERVGMPVVLGNDANAAALAEWRFGAGVGTRNLVYVTVSTGIGGGVINDGRLLLGRLGAAAELGFLILDADTGLGWEELASGTALGRAAATAMANSPDSLLHTLASAQTVTAVHVAQAAARGDALAVALMQREARLLGLGFASVLHAFSPDILVVGGGVVTENPDLLDQARTVAYGRAMCALYTDVPIVPARLGDQAGVLGAAALFWHAAED